MQAYGRKKNHTRCVGHQNCAVCHPIQKNKKKRARRSGKLDVSLHIDDDEGIEEEVAMALFEAQEEERIYNEINLVDWSEWL